MKLTIEIDPIEEADYAQIVANVAEVSAGLFELKHNFAKIMEHKIDQEQFDDQYELLDTVILEINELFPSITL